MRPAAHCNLYNGFDVLAFSLALVLLHGIARFPPDKRWVRDFGRPRGHARVLGTVCERPTKFGVHVLSYGASAAMGAAAALRFVVNFRKNLGFGFASC